MLGPERGKEGGAIKKHPLDKLMNRLSLLVLAGTAVFLAAYWHRIPARVPMHFNAAGQIDRWGSQAELLILPVIAWLMYGLLTVVEQFPSAWNTGVKVTEENRERVYALLAHMLSTLKFLMVVLFAWITVWCALARPLPVWFLPVVLIALFGDMIYWLVRLFRAR